MRANNIITLANIILEIFIKISFRLIMSVGLLGKVHRWIRRGGGYSSLSTFLDIFLPS
jgi:hypothetical protein